MTPTTSIQKLWLLHDFVGLKALGIGSNVAKREWACKLSLCLRVLDCPFADSLERLVGIASGLLERADSGGAGGTRKRGQATSIPLRLGRANHSARFGKVYETTRNETSRTKVFKFGGDDDPPLVCNDPHRR